MTAILSMGLLGSVFAQTATPVEPAASGTWAKNHPRRVEVNSRIIKQNERITAERKSGEITKEQAQTLRAEDKSVRTDEKAMAAQNNGHITKAEKKALNQQENNISKQIGK